jgi:hypothetical protein
MNRNNVYIDVYGHHILVQKQSKLITYKQAVHFCAAYALHWLTPVYIRTQEGIEPFSAIKKNYSNLIFTVKDSDCGNKIELYFYWEVNGIPCNEIDYIAPIKSPVGQLHLSFNFHGCHEMQLHTEASSNAHLEFFRFIHKFIITGSCLFSKTGTAKHQFRHLSLFFYENLLFGCDFDVLDYKKRTLPKF